MGAQPGDIVIGDGGVKISKLTRRGVEKLSGSYILGSSLSVRWETVEPPPPPPPNPAGRLLAFVLPNRSLNPPFYPRNGMNLPDTRAILGGARTVNCGRTPLTDKIQDLIFYNNFKNAYGVEFSEADEQAKARAVNQFIYLLGYKLAFCNDAGADTRKVPIANLNMKADWPQGNQLTFSGIIELVEDKTYTILGKPNQIPFYTINGQHPHIEDFTFDAYPYRWKRPVIAKRQQVPEGSEPFDQFQARLRWPTLSNGTEVGFIDARLIRKLGQGEPFPSPFTKDWGS